MISIVARVFYNFVRLLTAPMYFIGRLATRPKSRWIHVRLRPRIVEIERPLPFFLEWVPGVSEARPTSLTLLRELTDLLVEDDRIEGVVFDIPPLVAGWATCQSLRDILVRIRDSGRQVVAYLPQGGGNRELYVASAADRILASPHSQLSPIGLAASVTYFKGLLDTAGIEVEVHRRAEYKTAIEPATRDSMSEAQREQTEALLETVDRALRDALAARPGCDRAKVDEFFEAALMSAERAMEAGLIDGVCYEDELPVSLKPHREVTPVVRAPRYYAWRKERFLKKLVPERFIAVVPIHGPITGGGPATRGGIKLATTIATLRAARRNPMVAGVVLHVDSPGGSALASDLIHREVERLKERKPVVACFGDVAASGGYYVAAGADAVVAQPLTITGSIGVVSARLVTEPLLARFGVRVDTVRKAPHADMFRRPGKLAAVEDAILDREIESFYRTFVGVVARGRGRKVDDIEPLARGRVWSGKDAAERGLVDRLGGLDVALDEVRARLAGRMSDRARRELAPRFVRVRRLELPPAEPRAVDRAAAALLGQIDPRLAELWALARGEERVLCYAANLPRIL
ncbi:MAG TPA: signal peptide peptidase SppA [Sandaracinaceae bacterium]